jgi:hypothetical protein
MFIGVPFEVGMVVVGSATIFLLRMMFNNMLAPSFAQRLSIVGDKKLVKFKENAFNAIFYTLSLSIGALGLYKSRWLELPLIPDTKCLFPSVSDWTNDWSSIFTQLYYGIATSYYLQATVTSVTIDTQRKDKWVMFSHHIITLVLLIGSAYIGRFRIGFLILLAHDVSDIFLSVTKVLHYAKSPWDRSFFFLFAVSFIVLRLVLLPYYTFACMKSYGCTWQTVYLDFGSGFRYDNIPYVFGQDAKSITLFGLTFVKFGILIAFLFMLIVMHAWWATIILKMAFGGATQDERSDDEDDDKEKME